MFKNLILVLIITVLCLSGGCAPAKPQLEFQKGMCYVTWSKNQYASAASDESLAELANTGTEWVAVVVTWYQESCQATKIFPSAKAPSDDSVRHAIETIHSLGMKVMLKPHLDLIDISGGSWRGEIACAPEEWVDWFENYRNFILHYAKMAAEEKVELFCIGTELTSVATIKENMWKEYVIRPVKEIYKGKLTYAANWNEEFNQIKFWDELDYVGIDAYFPLSGEERPSLAELKSGWQKWVAEIEEFQKRVNKPIIFPEIGYCSAKGAAKSPWEEGGRGELDIELQADCYEAMFEAFWDKEWFYGVYWWRWGADVRFGGPSNKSFSLQNKPALDVLKKWYGKEVPKKMKF